MLALARPTPRLPNQYYPDDENVRQYVSAQIRQLSPDRSSRAAMGKTSMRQNISYSVEPVEKSIRRSASTVAGKSTPDAASATEPDDPTSTTSGATTKPRALQRSNTDVGPRRQSSPEKPDITEEWEMRHGYDEQYNSTKYLEHLSSVSAFMPL